MPNASGNFRVHEQPNIPGNLQVSTSQNETKQANRPSFPLLVLSSEGNTSYPDNPEWNVYDYGTNASIRCDHQKYIPGIPPDAPART